MSYPIARIIVTAAAVAAIAPALQAQMLKKADSLYALGAYGGAADAYAQLVTQFPDSARLWSRLGSAAHSAHDYTRSARSFEHVARLLPKDPFSPYNAAAAHARLGHADAAFQWLDTAVARGFALATLIKTDSDLVQLRSDPRMTRIVAEVTKRWMPCATDENAHRFDFWIGEWDVRGPGDRAAGHSIIEPIAGQCALLENWTDTQGGTGKSINAYNAEVKAWQQYWIGQQGGVTEYRDSEWQNGTLVYHAVSVDAAGKRSLIRLSFSPISPDEVRQHGEISTDDGKSWSTQYDLRYHRVKK